MMNGFLKGLLVGVGVSAVGLYLYKANEEKVDDFLRAQGIPIAQPGKKNYANYSVEELMRTKEDIEDLIAERETNEDENVIVCDSDSTVTV